MTDTVPPSVSSSLDALTSACRAWPHFGNAALGLSGRPEFEGHAALAREVCGLLVQPARTHAFMFATATLSVIGLLIFAGMGYVTLRTAYRIIRWMIISIRKGEQVS